jgi:hypothetical protein
MAIMEISTRNKKKWLHQGSLVKDWAYCILRRNSLLAILKKFQQRRKDREGFSIPEEGLLFNTYLMAFSGDKGFLNVEKMLMLEIMFY